MGIGDVPKGTRAAAFFIKKQRESGKIMEANTKEKTSRKKKKQSSGKALKTLLIVLAALVAVLGTLYYFVIYREQQRESIINGTTFHEGISVNGVDISGMTMDAARTALKDSVEKDIAAGVHLNFTCNGQSYAADSSYFTITYTTEQVLEEAMGLVRDGEYTDIREQLRDIKENGREFTIEYSVEPTGIEAFIHTFADAVTIEPTPATFTVRIPKIKENTKVPDTRNLGLVGEAAKEAKLGEEAIAITDVRDVFFDFVEAVDGYGVDIPGLMETVQQRCEALDFGDIEVQMAPIQSDITIDTLKESLVLRGSASTSYRSKRRNENRCFNLEKACGMVYGTTLQPGEVFSANGILGDRTLALNWKPASAVISGGAAHEDQPGGGVCQIATTTYMAVLYGDYEVVYRRPHSTPSGYPDGLDATINTVTGDIDFQWKNNTESPLYVFTWIDTKNYYVHCDIYGEAFPDTFDEIELSSKLIETLVPGAPEYEVKSSLYSPYWMIKNDAVTGYVYESFKTYKLAGKEVETKSIGLTTYKMHPTRYYVWPGYAGEPLNSQYQLVADDDGNLSLATPTVDPTTGTTTQ